MSKGKPLPSCRECGSHITGGSNEGVYGVGLCEYCEEAAIQAHAKRLLEARNTPSPAHGPGPWSICPIDIYTYILDGEGFKICEIVTSGEPEKRANARLIVAAPELLELCKVQRENWQMLQSGEWDGNHEGIRLAIENLTQAIAKAEGRA